MTTRRGDRFCAIGATVAIILLALNLRLVFGSASALVPDISKSLHPGTAWIAVLTTGPVVCLGVCGFLAPRALRSWGSVRSVAGCLALIAVGTAVRGFGSWWLLVAGTFIAGVGIAVANVLGPVVVREFFPAQLGVMTGLFTALVSASAGMASGLSIPLGSALGIDWPGVLAVWSVPAVAALVVFVVLSSARGRVSGKQVDQPAPSPRTAPTRVGASLTAWAVTGFMGLQSLLAYSLIAWLPSICRDRGLSAQVAGLTLTVVSVASIVTALAVPMIATRLRDQRWMAVAVVMFSVVGLIGVVSCGAGAIPVFAVLLGLGQGGQLSLALSLVNLRSGDISTVADLSTMVQSVGYLIAAGGPLLVGIIHGWASSWTASLVFLLVITGPLVSCGWMAGRPRVIGRG